MRSRTHSSVEQRLNGLFSPLLEEKKLTHFYIAWGSLEESKVSKQFMNPVGNFFFDLASLTKVLATLPLILKQFPSYRSLERSLSSFLSGTDSKLFPPSIRDLSLVSILRHSSGLAAWRNYWTNRLSPDFNTKLRDRFERRAFVFDRISKSQNILKAEKEFLYSDVGYLLLGIFLESICNDNLSELFHRYCIEDLGILIPEIFFPKKIETQQFVPTSYCLIRDRQLVGEVHDENAASLGGECGHAGLFGSGEGLVGYLKSYFNSALGKSLLLENQRLSKGSELGQFLLGWQHDRFEFASNELLMKHLGFTGTGIWILPHRKAFVTILTNRVISSRTSSWIQDLRRDVCKILWEEDLKFLELVEHP